MLPYVEITSRVSALHNSTMYEPSFPDGWSLATATVICRRGSPNWDVYEHLCVEGSAHVEEATELHVHTRSSRCF